MQYEIVRDSHLFEGLEDVGSLAEVLEDELQGAGHQRRVVLHDEVDEDPQERPAALIVQLHCTLLLTAGSGNGTGSPSA